MTTRQFVSSKGETWEWEETPEVLAALEKLHANAKIISDLENEASDYGVGK